MLSNKNKYILYLVLLNGVLTTLLVTSGQIILKQGSSIIGIAIALAMFFFYALFVILFTENKTKNISSRQTVNLFLGFKVGKILLSLLFLTIYSITVKAELKHFIGVFLILYFIFLLFETVYLLNREKSLKTIQYQNKEIV